MIIVFHYSKSVLWSGPKVCIVQAPALELGKLDVLAT